MNKIFIWIDVLHVSIICRTNDRHMSGICTPKSERMRAMEKITVRLPEQQIRMLNILVACGEFPSVSEAVRDAVRELIERREDKIMEKIKILSEMS